MTSVYSIPGPIRSEIYGGHDRPCGNARDSGPVLASENPAASMIRLRMCTSTPGGPRGCGFKTLA